MSVAWFQNPTAEFKKLPERLRNRIIRSSPRSTACWLWIGPLHNQGVAGDTETGYARQWWEGKNWLAHRLIYTLLIGPIPEERVLDHLKERCTAKRCVRPDHLEPVTSWENNARGGGWFGNKFRKARKEPEEEVPF